MAGNRMTIAYIRDGTLNVTYHELTQLDRAALYDLVGKRIFENANRRVRNIRVKKDLISPAVYDVKKGGGLFSAKGKDKEQLIREILRADNFLKQQTSTVRGAKQFTREIDRLQPNLTPRERSVVWDIFHNIEANNPIYFAELKKKNGLYGDSHRLVREIETVVRNQRAVIPSGLGGDLLSRDKKEIRATAGERSRAIENLKQFFRNKYDKIEKEIVRKSGKSLSIAYEDAYNALYRNGTVEIERV